MARARASSLIHCAALTLVAGAVAACASGRPATMRLESDGTPAVRLTDGRLSASIDLGADLTGCTGELYDPMDSRRIDGGGVRIRLLDERARDDVRYVLLGAAAPPSCNVQAHCGASERPDVVLLWLRLAPDFSLAEKRAVVVEDCRGGRYVSADADNWFDLLRANNGIFTIPFADLGAGPGGQDVEGRAVYDTRSPDAGVLILGGGAPR